MLTTDEDLLRDLLHSSTDDLALPPGRAHAIVTRQRRRQVRRRFAAAGVTGVAAAVALTVAESGSAPLARQSLAGPAHAHARTVHLTAGQVVLDGLAVRAAAQPDGGRYVVFTEDRAPIRQTTVYDRSTGDMWVYQQGGGAPPVTVRQHGSPTSAELAAKLPASQAALRAFLISDANADDAKAAAFTRRKPHAPPYADKRTDNGKLFDQAVDYLYMPLVPSAQRSALFRLLAATPGVQVTPHARDSLGRPAIMLRHSEGPGYGTTTVFEDPATTRPLEEDFAGAGFTGKDIFNSIIFTSTRPADPYQHR